MPLVRGRRSRAAASRRVTAPPASQPDTHCGPGQRLRDVATVGDPKLEERAAPRTANVEPAERQAPHHAARCANDDDDAEPHADRDASLAPEPRREQHERIVVAGLHLRR